MDWLSSLPMTRRFVLANPDNGNQNFGRGPRQPRLRCVGDSHAIWGLCGDSCGVIQPVAKFSVPFTWTGNDGVADLAPNWTQTR